MPPKTAVTTPSPPPQQSALIHNKVNGVHDENYNPHSSRKKDRVERGLFSKCTSLIFPLLSLAPLIALYGVLWAMPLYTLQLGGGGAAEPFDNADTPAGRRRSENKVMDVGEGHQIERKGREAKGPSANEVSPPAPSSSSSLSSSTHYLPVYFSTRACFEGFGVFSTLHLAPPAIVIDYCVGGEGGGEGAIHLVTQQRHAHSGGVNLNRLDDAIDDNDGVQLHHSKHRVSVKGAVQLAKAQSSLVRLHNYIDTWQGKLSPPPLLNAKGNGGVFNSASSSSAAAASPSFFTSVANKLQRFVELFIEHFQDVVSAMVVEGDATMERLMLVVAAEGGNAASFAVGQKGKRGNGAHSTPDVVDGVDVQSSGQQANTPRSVVASGSDDHWLVVGAAEKEALASAVAALTSFDSQVLPLLASVAWLLLLPCLFVGGGAVVRMAQSSSSSSSSLSVVGFALPLLLRALLLIVLANHVLLPFTIAWLTAVLRFWGEGKIWLPQARIFLVAFFQTLEESGEAIPPTVTAAPVFSSSTATVILSSGFYSVLVIAFLSQPLLYACSYASALASLLWEGAKGSIEQRAAASKALKARLAMGDAVRRERMRRQKEAEEEERGKALQQNSREQSAAHSPPSAGGTSASSATGGDETSVDAEQTRTASFYCQCLLCLLPSVPSAVAETCYCALHAFIFESCLLTCMAAMALSFGTLVVVGGLVAVAAGERGGQY